MDLLQYSSEEEENHISKRKRDDGTEDREQEQARSKKIKKVKKDKKEKKKRRVMILPVFSSSSTTDTASNFATPLLSQKEALNSHHSLPSYVEALTAEHDATPLPTPLPPLPSNDLATNWKQCTQSDGTVYYQHSSTKQTTFTRPVGVLNSFMPD
jgi:hypothetical protein